MLQIVTSKVPKAAAGMASPSATTTSPADPAVGGEVRATSTPSVSIPIAFGVLHRSRPGRNQMGCFSQRPYTKHRPMPRLPLAPKRVVPRLALFSFFMGRSGDYGLARTPRVSGSVAEDACLSRTDQRAVRGRPQVSSGARQGHRRSRPACWKGREEQRAEMIMSGSNPKKCFLIYTPPRTNI